MNATLLKDVKGMNKIAILNQLLSSFRDYDHDTIIGTLIYTLSSEEACMFLDLKFEQEPRIRGYILRKIANDITLSFRPEHKILIKKLLKKSIEKKFNKKYNCIYTLIFLSDHFPNRDKEKIRTLFLNSPNQSNRNLVLRRIKKNWEKKYQSIIEQVWKTYHDNLCLDIIINHFPIDYLFRNYKELMFFCSLYQATRLSLKVVTIDVLLVKELKSIDPISYAYVIAKSNNKITEIEAKEILRNDYPEKKISLLLWSFGKMGFWDIILEYMVEKWDNIYFKKNKNLRDNEDLEYYQQELPF